jgi:hypothetical protein
MYKEGEGGAMRSRHRRLDSGASNFALDFKLVRVHVRPLSVYGGPIEAAHEPILKLIHKGKRIRNRILMS